ncbi:hypothetical protein [Aeromonas sanarellii]|uniref:hypothetical protein n=1 Tax=Aeromonas sanarellii TaxID=633415 RepID=UPI0038D1315D
MSTSYAGKRVVQADSHLVLKVDAEQTQGWSKREVTEHWAVLLQWPLLVRRWYQRY